MAIPTQNFFNTIKNNLLLSFCSNSLIALASLGISLAFGEFFLSLFWNPVPNLVETSSVQGLALPSYPDFIAFTPNQSTYVTSRTCEFTNLYTINSMGMRDREHSIDKNTTRKIVLCVGDSFTEGVGVDQDNTYPYLIQDRSHGEIECLNAGIRGTSPSQAYFRIKRFLNSGISLDAVVIQLFSNDFKDDQIYTKQHNLRVIEGELVRDPFHRTAGGAMTRIMGPAALPIYKTNLFLLVFSSFLNAPTLEPFSVSYSPETAEQVLEIFTHSQVEGITRIKKNNHITLQFPFLPTHTLNKDDLNRLWHLLGTPQINKLNINIFDTDEGSPKPDSQEVQQSLYYLDCTFNLLKQRLIPFIVYFAPCASDESNSKAIVFSQWCKNHNIPFVFPLKELVQFTQETGLPVFYPFDGHMTEEGHRVVASILLDHVISLL